VSDGTVTTQVGDDGKILPMLPKAFLIVRNITITANDWGQAGAAFENAQSQYGGGGQSSSSSFGGSVGFFGIGGSVQHQQAQESSAFGQSQQATSGWSFTKTGDGGTLNLYGSQICGWIGEIQPASPPLDDPNLSSSSSSSSNSSSSSSSSSSPVMTGQGGGAGAPGQSGPPPGV
jgi:hypothetical protein